MDVTVPTWTRTLNERDAYELLDLAEPGMPLAEWRERGHARLPQASHARRRELVREVERDLLDHDGTAVTPSAFLRLFHAEGPHVRQGLFLGRVLMARPGVAEALDELVLPAVARADEPLALPDDAHVPGHAWDEWLHTRLPAGTGPSATEKTRQTLQRHLALAGVLVPDEAPDTGGTARRARPAPLAFAWTVAWELVRAGRTEATLSWALHASFAARLWATDEAYARSCVDQGAAAGLLTLGYLAGEPRIHPGELR